MHDGMGFENATMLYYTLVPIVILFYGIIFYKFYQELRKKTIFKGFFRAVKNIVSSTNDIDQGISEINLNFRKLASSNSAVKDLIKNPTDLLEELIFNIDNLTGAAFRRKFGFEIDAQTRGKIISYVTRLREENPYVSLPPKEGNLLAAIQEAFEIGNKEMGKNALIQLAEDIEIMDNNFKIQEKKNVSAYIVSVVGVILTIIFGIISLIPFFK